MKHLIIFAAFIFTPPLQAEIITGQIHAIENGIIKFNNGRVAFLDAKKMDINVNDIVKVVLDERSSLKSLEKISSQPNSTMKAYSLQTDPVLFEPTIVQGMDEAWKIFNRSNPNYKRISECTDRAHVWAHDEFKISGIKSKKAFVFLTASYINSVRFKWWFHVAPLYTVNDRGSIKELVMDFRFTDHPMSIKEWTDQFVYTRRDCKVTTKFSEYDVNPQTENCYLIFESMHYKIPGEIHEQETNGRYKTTTSESELKASFNYAFQR